MRVWSVLAVFFSVSIICSGCGGDGNGDSRTPEQACRDVADAVGDFCDRCGESYTECYNSFLESAVDGDCANVQAVRDMDLLYDVCIPWFVSLGTIGECDNFLAGTLNLDSSCENQLLH